LWKKPACIPFFYFGQVERGEQTVSVHALVRIAKALGVRVRNLVNDL
jgi:transcriptional regulator with XRE-family HTH domain